MSRNNLELSRQNGILYLSFWDSWHGNDIILEIEDNGKVYEVHYEEDKNDPDNIDVMIKIRVEVDIIDSLHKVAQMLQNRYDD